MNSLYKRIITLGMVSVTALLAWIYCMAVFPKQPVYLAIISLVLVVSLYALLNALTGLNIENSRLTSNRRQTI
jgi:ABC-type branched-subunit amino acid transport system permease subunit